MSSRRAIKLSAILLFYLFIASLVAVFSTSIGVFAYPVIIAASLLFILALRLKVNANGFLVGLVAAVFFMGIVLAVMFLSGAASVGGLKENFISILLFGVVLELFVGFGEELSFRAVIFQGLSDELGLWPAVLISAAAFALLHIPSMEILGVNWPLGAIALLTIFFAGVALALLYAYGGIFNAVAFHMTWNFIEYNLFNLGPLEGAINVSKAGPDILTGGAFGPEASIQALLCTIILVFAIWLYYTRLKKTVSQ